MLMRYVADPSHVLYYEPLEIREDATYVEQTVGIIDTKEHVLWTKTIHWMKGTVGASWSRGGHVGALRPSVGAISTSASTGAYLTFYVLSSFMPLVILDYLN